MSKVAKKTATEETFLRDVQQAIEASDSRRVGELFNELIASGVQTGAVDEAAARQMRIEAAVLLVRMAPATTRQKVTLSLPDDVLQALRLASAESGKEMSLIVSDALKSELKNYHHAAQALKRNTPRSDVL